MSNFVISLILSIGAAGWLYSKFARRSGGGNTGPAAIGAAVAGFIIFVVVFLTLGLVLD